MFRLAVAVTAKRPFGVGVVLSEGGWECAPPLHMTSTVLNGKCADTL